jgi:membrane-associated protease RseP (regulator of RpoE activity)
MPVSGAPLIVTTRSPIASPERVARVGWASEPVPGPRVTTFFGTTESRLGRIDRDAQVGRYTIRRPIVCLVPESDGEYLGSDVLRHFAITIDQKNDRVRFSRASTAPIEVPSLRTLGFGLDRDGTVKEILPTSAAARSGLAIGDRVVTINGAPLTGMRPNAKEYLEEQGEPVRLQVERDGAPRTVAVPVTTLVP